MKAKIIIALALLASAFVNVSSVCAKECVFCRQELLVEQSLFEGEYFNILLDFSPRIYGHLLVIPKRHVEKAHEMSKEEWEEFSKLVSLVVQVFSEFMHTDEYVIMEKNGSNGFQDVPHVHFHFLPFTKHYEWTEIFCVRPEQLQIDKFRQQSGLFRSYFEFLKNGKS